MSIITKEWLRSQISAIKTVGITDSNTLQAFEIALASLEAEPVGYADPQAFRNFQAGAARREWMWRNPGEDLIAVYTAPPAPVPVPDEMTPKQASRAYCGEVRGYRDGWNACRAAMLQGGKS